MACLSSKGVHLSVRTGTAELTFLHLLLSLRRMCFLVELKLTLQELRKAP